MRSRPRPVLAAVMVTAMALLSSACGSSKPTATTATTATTAGQASPASSPSTTSANSQQPTGTPVVVGTLGDLSGAPGEAAEADLAATPKAWVAWTNAHGGIDGHPVRLDIIDDGADPGRAVAAVHQLVQDKVIAIVYDEDIGIETGYTTYLQQEGIPVVGGQDYDTVWEHNSDLFATMATVSAKGYADDYAAHYAGATTVAEAYCSELAACLQDVQAQKAAEAQAGVTVAVTGSASSSAPDYTSQCLNMLKTNAQAFYFSDGVSPIEHMATDCARQGFKGFWILPNPDQSELSVAPLSKFAIGQDLQLPFFAQLPQTLAFRQAMAQYARGVELQTNSLRIWAAFDVVKKALEEVPTETPSPQAVKDGLYKLDGFNDNGLTPPLTYRAGQPTVIKCFIIWGIKNGQFVLPKGDTYQCAP